VSIIKLVLNGKPISKARHRDSKGRKYDPRAEEKETVRWLMKSKSAGLKLIEGPISVEFEFIFKRPKSSKREHHTVKPDLDNLEKFYMDCANGIIWRDDCEVIRKSGYKRYGETEMTIMVIHGQAD